MTKKVIEQYKDWVEQQNYRNIETNEIVKYAGEYYNADTKQRGVSIFRGNDAIVISHEEFKSKYVKV